MIKARIRWCSFRVENIITLGKLLRLWVCFLLHSILFFISQTSYLRGHVQTIFGKINVIMTLRGGGGGGSL